MTRLFLTSFLLFSLVGIINGLPVTNAPLQASTAVPQEIDTRAADYALAQRFVPVFAFHPEEIYLPQPVEVALTSVRVRQDRRMWFDANLLLSPTPADLSTLACDEACFLDQWFGDSGSSEYTNYTAHQQVYQSALHPQSGGPEPVTYAHIVRDENPNHITIQYWVFYFYNDWFNKHEGDWEMVELILSADEQPEWVVYSQHHGGTRRSWDTTPRVDETHPLVFVARGSHANYFTGNEIYPNGQDVGNERVDIMDRTGDTNRLVPRVVLVPTRAGLAADPGGWPGAEWLLFRGRWGETGPQNDFSGPYGPADKGEQWEQPLAWGIRQPLDVDIWYKNRLRVETARPEQGQDRVRLCDENGQVLPQSESFGSLAILHAGPPDTILAQIEGAPGTRWGMTISWPDEETGHVIQTRFLSFEIEETGQAQLAISAPVEVSPPAAPQDEELPLEGALPGMESGLPGQEGGLPGMEASAMRLETTLLSGAGTLDLQPAEMELYHATWDAPDLVWLGNVLPFQKLPGGFLIALVYSLVPTLIFVTVLYWVNRYRKEPVRLLSIAFLWGAIPALMVALLVELFFKLPLNLIGPNALEAVRLGILAPVLEEVFKAAGVLYIFRRYHHEINDVLDGMVYGAVVGFGFSMTANLLRYIGSFLIWGYPALNSGMVLENTFHALDHGLFTAIFGVGLGLARMAKSQKQSSWLVFGALGLAIAIHALRNLLANSLVGLNAFTEAITLSGTLVLWIVAGWSLVQQRRLLKNELAGLIPDALYSSVLDPLSRTEAQWSALRRDGFTALREVRRLQALCIQLAHTRLQVRLFPEKGKWPGDAVTLQEEIGRVFDGMTR